MLFDNVFLNGWSQSDQIKRLSLLCSLSDQYSVATDNNLEGDLKFANFNIGCN